MVSNLIQSINTNETVSTDEEIVQLISEYHYLKILKWKVSFLEKRKEEDKAKFLEHARDFNIFLELGMDNDNMNPDHLLNLIEQANTKSLERTKQMIQQEM